MNSSTDKKKVKDRYFSKKVAWKRILTFTFFLVIASILWFMQIYNQLFETNLRVPIKYKSVPDSIIFTDSLPTLMDVRVRDYGSNMFKYHWGTPDSIVIDVASIINNSTSSKNLQGVALEVFINEALTQSAQLLRYDPARINFSYSSLESRKLPVIFDGQINLSPGYFLNGDIQISPDSVTVYGTATDLAKMTYVYTNNDTISGLESDENTQIKLVKKRNLRYSTDKVNIFTPVEAYKQVKIFVPVECLNLPDNMIVKFFPSGVTLSFFTGVSMADSINLSDFSVAVDYEGLKESKQVSVPVRIKSSPPYAKNLTIDPPNVEYVFGYKDASKK